MEFNSVEHVIFGFLSGLTEILPVSANAHRVLMMKVLGADHIGSLPVLLIHIGILAALYTYSRVHLVKMARARKLYRIPKKKRKRPLDANSLMDSRFLSTMVIPVILIMLAYNRISSIKFGLLPLAAFLFMNGMILYIPQFLPGSNRDARSLSRVDGLLMGLGGTLSVIPGFSGVGAAVSVGSVCGVERSYALNMTIILDMFYILGLIIHDIISLIARGPGVLTLPIICTYALSAVASFISTMLGIRIMRALAAEAGYLIFAYYCWGIAIFAFILNLMA